MLGRDQGLPIEERVGRWVSAYPRVKARLAERAQIVDLRYPNGFAVRAMGPGPASAKVGAAGSAGASKDDTARLPAGEGSALLAAFTEQGATYP